MIEEWQQRILEAASSGKKLQICGGGSKSFYGQTPEGGLLNTSDHSGIVDYEPSELVITAKAGTPLIALEKTLAEQQQMLAFDPPHFGSKNGSQATIGGCIAAGLSGPRRASVGSARDFVLGTQLLDGNGKLLNLGGQVMKNVAGYDVSRFLTGSMGILGIISEVSLKVLPLPEFEQTLIFDFNQQAALNTLCEWASKPLPISASAWHQGQLHLRLSGAEPAVVAAAKQLGGEPLETTKAKLFWQQLNDHQHGFFSNDKQALWRLALPATTAKLAIDGIDDANTLLEWNGSQRWLNTDIDANTLRKAVSALGGHATLFRNGDKQQGVFTPLSTPLMMLHKNLKQAFDPRAIFNPGRLYPNL